MFENKKILDKLNRWGKISGNDKNYLNKFNSDVSNLQKNSTHGEDLESLHLDPQVIVSTYIESILQLVNWKKQNRTKRVKDFFWKIHYHL